MTGEAEFLSFRVPAPPALFSLNYADMPLVNHMGIMREPFCFGSDGIDSPSVTHIGGTEKFGDF